jgi:hypothetical protein
MSIEFLFYSAYYYPVVELERAKADSSHHHEGSIMQFLPFHYFHCKEFK